MSFVRWLASEAIIEDDNFEKIVTIKRPEAARFKKFLSSCP
jgi:hypothetical protein